VLTKKKVELYPNVSIKVITYTYQKKITQLPPQNYDIYIFNFFKKKATKKLDNQLRPNRLKTKKNAKQFL
jgi:hypothetical protein